MTEKPTDDWGNEPAIDRQKVIELNDCLRQNFEGGQIMITHGIAKLSNETRIKIFQAIQNFDEFNPDNDPYGEHDLGSVRVDDHSVFWKIDYYDQQLNGHSPAKDDPNVTRRVMTVMLAEEY